MTSLKSNAAFATRGKPISGYNIPHQKAIKRLIS